MVYVEVNRFVDFRVFEPIHDSSGLTEDVIRDVEPDILVDSTGYGLADGAFAKPE